MKRMLELILSNCLADVIERGLSPEEALSKHPDNRKELEPLLLTALRVSSLRRDIGPSARFKAATKEMLMLEAAGNNAKTPGRAVRLSANVPAALGQGRNRWAAFSARAAGAAAAFLMALTVGGAGSVYASMASVPGDPLYGVKTAAENARLVMAFSEDEKTSLYITMAENRLGELSRVAGRDPQAAQSLAEVYKRTVMQARNEARKADSEGAVRMVEARVSHHAEALQAAYQNVSESAQPAIALALQVSQPVGDSTSRQPAITAPGGSSAAPVVNIPDNTAKDGSSSANENVSVPIITGKDGGESANTDNQKGFPVQPGAATEPSPPRHEGTTTTTEPIAITAKDGVAATTEIGSKDNGTAQSNISIGTKSETSTSDTQGALPIVKP